MNADRWLQNSPVGSYRAGLLLALAAGGLGNGAEMISAAPVSGAKSFIAGYKTGERLLVLKALLDAFAQ